MSTELIYWLLWALVWFAIMALQNQVSHLSEAYEKQKLINNTMLDIIRDLEKQIDRK